MGVLVIDLSKAQICLAMLDSNITRYTRTLIAWLLSLPPVLPVGSSPVRLDRNGP